MKHFKHWMNTSVITLIVITLTMMAVGCAEEQNQQRAEKIRPVKMVTVQTAESRHIREYPAQVEADSLVALSFNLTGTITNLVVDELQEIEAGALIAQLDQENAQTELDAAKSAFEKAKTDYERAENLFKDNAIAKSVVDERRTAFDTAQSQLTQAEKRFEDTTLFAPFSGMVAVVEVEKDQVVSAGQTVITMFDPNKLHVTVAVPATMVRDSGTRTNRQSFIMFDGDQGPRIPAEFKDAKPLADISSQTYSASFSFTAPENMLVLPGMFARLEVSSESVDEASYKDMVFLPLGSVFSDGEKHYVWLVDPQTQQISKLVVEVVKELSDVIFIKSGVKADDQVVAAGASFLSEGMKVRPWEAQQGN